MFTPISSKLLICIAVSFAYVLCSLGNKFWIAELATHFYLHMAVACLIFAIIFLFTKQYFYALWITGLLLLFAIPTGQAFSPSPVPLGKETAKLTILQFNVLYSNGKLADAIPWIIKQNADIVILQEISSERAAELGELTKHYSWSKIKVNEGRDAFGMAIFSNLPLSKFDYVPIGNGWNHYTMSEIEIGKNKLHLYEIHTPPPVSDYFASQRNFNLQLMADILAKDNAPHRLLLGDLNCTIYSPYFQNITQKADLHHAQQGYNMQGTWPNWIPAPLRIGIDHIIASQQIKIVKREIGSDHGSDHMPVITTLHLYN